MKKLFFVATMLTMCLFSTHMKAQSNNAVYFYQSFNGAGVYLYSFQGITSGGGDVIISMNLQDDGLWPTDFKLSTNLNSNEALITMYRIHDSVTSCQLQGTVFLNGHWNKVVYNRAAFPLGRGGGVGWHINISVTRLP